MFCAKELMRLSAPGGKIGHAEIEIGDSRITLTDPFGHIWHIATHIEDVTEAEIERRIAAMSVNT
jgi:uncharacterized glyoxalase superfamily protein PhnB